MEKKVMKGYIESVGRRKTAVARVRMTPAAKSVITVNGKPVSDYFKTVDLVRVVGESLASLKEAKEYAITVKVVGGGVHSQAEAIRHGISRSLVKEDESLKVDLKKEGFMKRDPRSKERRKFGLRKARKSPQWSKR